MTIKVGSSVVVGTADFIASGTLPNGSPVILKANGTIEAVSSAGPPDSIPAGVGSVFNSGSTDAISMSADPNNSGSFIIVYRDGGNANYGTAVAGTISGTTITFGSEYVFNSANTSETSVSFDPNSVGKFVITYQDVGSTDNGEVIVGTVSGNTITFGSPSIFNSTYVYEMVIAFDPNSVGKFVIAYRDYESADSTRAIVGTVSGNSVTFGAEYTLDSSHSTDISIAFDPNSVGKFAIAYRADEASWYGKVVIGTVSGTVITFGSVVTFQSATIRYPSITFDPNNVDKFVIVYRNDGNSSYGTGVIGTVFGTNIVLGNTFVFNSASTFETSGSFDPNKVDKFIITHNGGVIIGSISGTTFTSVSEHVFASAAYYTAMSLDPSTSGNFVVAYSDKDNSYFGTAVVGQIGSIVTNLTTSNFLGISTASYTDTQTASIMLQGGISDNQTGLTIGSTYYIQPDGTFATTEGTPSVIAGKAVKPTTLLLRGL